MKKPSIEELASRVMENPYSYPLANRQPEDPDIEHLRLNDPIGYAKLQELRRKRLRELIWGKPKTGG